ERVVPVAGLLGDVARDRLHELAVGAVLGRVEHGLQRGVGLLEGLDRAARVGERDRDGGGERRAPEALPLLVGEVGARGHARDATSLRAGSVALVKVAVFADVHAHADALDAVLRAADAAGAEEIWSLGDMVGSGPDAAAVV